MNPESNKRGVKNNIDNVQIIVKIKKIILRNKKFSFL